MAHYNACIWYWMGDFFYDPDKPEEPTWITQSPNSITIPILAEQNVTGKPQIPKP
jgi:hypothetical protein